MRNCAVPLVFVLLLVCCSSQKEAHIYGNWCLVQNQVNYPELVFKKDSALMLKSRADTIYFYKFYLDQNRLVIFKGDERIENDIIKLTYDSLVFSALLENANKQSYYRCKANQ